MALTKIKLNTMVTGTLPDANIPDDITIDTAAAVPASGLTGNTLASGVTASSLTSVGTLTGLTVTGNPIIQSDSGTLNFYNAAGTQRAFLQLSSTGLIIDTDSFLEFKPNNTTAMYIDSSGNVGIGETSPSERLHIGGGYADFRLYSRTGIEIGTLAFNEYYNGSAWVNDNSDIVSGAVRFSDSRDSLEFGVRAGGASAGYSSTHMTIKSTGRVGIGTNDPQKILHLENASPYTYYKDTDDNKVWVTGVGASRYNI